MSNNDKITSSILQMRIDNLLDQELEPQEQRKLLDQIHSCPDSGREYLLARAMHDAMLDMPRPEMPAELLANVYRQTLRKRVSLAERLRNLADTAFPAPAWRLAAPAFAALAAVAIWLQFSPSSPQDSPSPPIVQTPRMTDTEQYSREELIVAIEDLNVTIQTLNEITESMRTRLGDRMINLPVISMPALSIDNADSGDAAPAINDPI